MLEVSKKRSIFSTLRNVSQSHHFQIPCISAVQLGSVPPLADSRLESDCAEGLRQNRLLQHELADLVSTFLDRPEPVQALRWEICKHFALEIADLHSK